MPIPRRPLAFSLRTLLVLVGVLCLVATWLGRERRVATNRLIYRTKLESEGKVFGTAADNKVPSINRPPEVRWSRRIFGDEAIQFILSRGDLEDTAWQAQALEVFPEAGFLTVPTAERHVGPLPVP